MSGIHLYRGAALRALSHMHTDATEQHQRHLATRPSFPVSAFGRGFAVQGARIAALLERVHQIGSERIEALRITADTAAAQVRVYEDVDTRLGADLRRGQ